MAYVINLNHQPNQKGTFIVENRHGQLLNCGYSLRTIPDGLIMDLSVNSVPMFFARRAIDRVPMMTEDLGGNFYWVDAFGHDNPNYEEFNTRFKFIFDPDNKIYC